MRDWVTCHKFVVHLKILLLLVVSLQNNLPLAENGENFISTQPPISSQLK